MPSTVFASNQRLIDVRRCAQAPLFAAHVGRQVDRRIVARVAGGVVGIPGNQIRQFAGGDARVDQVAQVGVIALERPIDRDPVFVGAVEVGDQCRHRVALGAVVLVLMPVDDGLPGTDRQSPDHSCALTALIPNASTSAKLNKRIAFRIVRSFSYSICFVQRSASRQATILRKHRLAAMEGP